MNQAHFEHEWKTKSILMIKSTTSFADFPSNDLSPSYCHTQIPKRASKLFISAKSNNHLLKGNWEAVSLCCDKAGAGMLRFSPVAQNFDSTMKFKKVQQKYQRSNKYFSCHLCSFICIWAYDLSLHLRQKHGIHKKL